MESQGDLLAVKFFKWIADLFCGDFSKQTYASSVANQFVPRTYSLWMNNDGGIAVIEGTTLPLEYKNQNKYGVLRRCRIFEAVFDAQVAAHVRHASIHWELMKN